MSMRDYPINEMAAFLITPEVAAHIMLSCDRDSEEVPESIAAMTQAEFNAAAAAEKLTEEFYHDVYEAYSIIEDDVEGGHELNFIGEAETLCPDKTTNPMEKSFDEEPVAYIASAKAPTLFKAAYNSPEELLKEFQDKFAELKISLPDEFDWWRHIVSLHGSYFS